MLEMCNTVITSLVTAGVAVLGSSGFWNMRIKKLELAYKESNENDETLAKLDKVIESVNKMQGTLESMQHEHNKSDDLLLAVARDRIFHLCKTFTKNHDTDPDNMRDIVALLDPYKAKGGDGLADEYFESYRTMFRNHHGGD